MRNFARKQRFFLLEAKTSKNEKSKNLSISNVWNWHFTTTQVKPIGMVATFKQHRVPLTVLIDKWLNVFATIDKCGRNMQVLKLLQSVKQRYPWKKRNQKHSAKEEKKCSHVSVFILSAPLQECEDDKDCDSRAKCEEEKCICQGNTTGNGKYCRGN